MGRPLNIWINDMSSLVNLSKAGSCLIFWKRYQPTQSIDRSLTVLSQIVGTSLMRVDLSTPCELSQEPATSLGLSVLQETPDMRICMHVWILFVCSPDVIPL